MLPQPFVVEKKTLGPAPFNDFARGRRRSKRVRSRHKHRLTHITIKVPITSTPSPGQTTATRHHTLDGDLRHAYEYTY